MASTRITYSAIAGLIIVAMLVVLPWQMAAKAGLWVRLWWAMAGLLVLFLGVLGYGLRGHVAGIIIDNRNRVSLSKFQMSAWTVIVFASLITAAAVNIAGWGELTVPVRDPAMAYPLDIQISETVWAAVGLAGFTMVGTPLLLSRKMAGEPQEADITRTASALGMDAAQISSAGLVFGRSDVADASWLDIFRGDEVSNAGTIDLSKVQNFLITLLLLAAYSADMLRLLGTKAAIAGLPDFSEGMLVLMTISHGAYLSFKWVPHGRTGEARREGGADTAAGGATAANMRPVG